MPTRKITQYRYRKFAAEFFKRCNSIEAYKAAGYKARTQRNQITSVGKLFATPEVQKYLQEEFAKLQSRIELQQDRAMLEICRLAYSDMRAVAKWGPWGMELTESETLPDDVAAAVQDVTSTRKTRSFTSRDGNRDTVTDEEIRTKVKLHSKIQALQLLQEFFKRGDPLSAEAEAKVHALLLIMAQYVPRDRLEAFRAHVRVSFGIDIPDVDGAAPGTKKLTAGGASNGSGAYAPGRNGASSNTD